MKEFFKFDQTYCKPLAILFINDRLRSEQHFIMRDKGLLLEMEIVFKFINNSVLVSQRF